MKCMTPEEWLGTDEGQIRWKAEHDLWMAQYYFTRGFQPIGISQPPAKPLKTIQAVLKR